jgi:hypothetical protein
MKNSRVQPASLLGITSSIAQDFKVDPFASHGIF